MNPIHANIENSILWEAETSCTKIINDGTKIGVKSLTTLKKIPLNQLVRFAIYCALEVYQEKGFKKWAKNWLSGKDRSKESADAAEGAAGAKKAAAWAKKAALIAARGTAEAVAWAAAWAADAAAGAAAGAAEWAAGAAGAAVAKKINKKIKLTSILLKAIEDERS
jgi:hypothetical protein